METGVLNISDILRTVPMKLVWIYFFLVNLEVTEVMAEMCVYRRSKHNFITNKYDSVITTKECQWGCCYNSDAACCTAPISLIVGVVLGGVLMFSLIVATVCCCCVCRKNQRRTQRTEEALRPGAGHRPSSSNQQNVIFHSETSGYMDAPDYSRYDDQPPSYDEVMGGETNQAFKPETS